MDTLLLEPTEDTPMVLLNPKKGHMQLTGRSYMKDATTYYRAISEWLRNYMTNPQPHNIVEFELEYVNSSSHSMLVYLLEEINKYYIMGYNFEVIWKFDHEDDNLADIGNELKEMFDVPIHQQVLV